MTEHYGIGVTGYEQRLLCPICKNVRESSVLDLEYHLFRAHRIETFDLVEFQMLVEAAEADAEVFPKVLCQLLTERALK